MVLSALSIYVDAEELSAKINVSPRHNGPGAIETEQFRECGRRDLHGATFQIQIAGALR
jgi:hypothetical protein